MTSREQRVERPEPEKKFANGGLVWLSTLDPRLSTQPLGGVTEAHRSDTAGATVQLRPERFSEE